MPRQEVLDAVVRHLQREGLDDQSLRRIAQGAGTSHRMLLYHFGSREGLLAAVVDEVERREREATAAALTGHDPTTAIELLWKALTAPERAAEERQFFEMAAQAIQGRPGTEGLRERLVTPWLDLGEDLAGALGLDRATARVVTRIDVAVVRGLLLDLLATGDRAGVDGAFRRYLAWRKASLGQASTRPT